MNLNHPGCLSLPENTDFITHRDTDEFYLSDTVFSRYFSWMMNILNAILWISGYGFPP